MVDSGEKGKRGERMFAAFLKKAGWSARRGRQYSGGDDSPDVVHNVRTSGNAKIHFEVKFVEQFEIRKAMKQAHDDCGGNGIPVVAWKKKRKEWVAILPMKDFLNIVGE